MHLSHGTRSTAIFAPTGRGAESYRCLFRQAGGGKSNAGRGLFWFFCLFYRRCVPPPPAFLRCQSSHCSITALRRGHVGKAGKLKEIPRPPRVQSRIYCLSPERKAGRNAAVNGREPGEGERQGGKRRRAPLGAGAGCPGPTGRRGGYAVPCRGRPPARGRSAPVGRPSLASQPGQPAALLRRGREAPSPLAGEGGEARREAVPGPR